MATRNLSDLKIICERMGLTVVQAGKRPAKEDYFTALRAHFMAIDYPAGLPYTELEPMLCFAYWNLDKDEQDWLWEDNNEWVLGQKWTGARVVIHFVRGVGVFAQTRNLSMTNYRRQEVSKNLVFCDFVPDFTATIDCEAVVEKPIDTRGYTGKGEVTKTGLASVCAILAIDPEQSRKLQKDQNAEMTFKVFDITSVEGVDLRGFTLEHRKPCLETFQRVIGQTEIGRYFEFETLHRTGKKAMFEAIVAAGGEGAVMKNLNSRYIDSTSRNRNAWVKVKKRIEYDAKSLMLTC